MKFNQTKLLLLAIYLLTHSCINHDKRDLFIEVEDLMFYYPHEAESKLESLFQYPNLKKSAKINLLQGFLYYQKGDIDSAIIKIQIAQKKFIIERNNDGEGKCHFILGLIAESIGQWEQAKINYYSATKLISNNHTYTALSNYGIARCKKYLNEDYNNYLEKGGKITASLKIKELTLYSEYLNIILNKNFERNDIYKLYQIVDQYNCLDLKNNAAGVYRSIALKYKIYNELDSAIICLDKGITICSKTFPSISVLPTLYQTKGITYYKKNEKDSAQFYFKKAQQYYNEYHLYDRQYYAYTYLRRIAYDNNNYKEAYYLLDKALIAEKSSKTITKARTAKLMEISSDVYELQNQLSKQRNHKYLILTLLAFIIAILLFILRLTKDKNNKRLETIRNKNVELNKLIVSINEKVLMQKRYGIVNQEKAELKSKETLMDKFDNCYQETIYFLLNKFNILTPNECRYALLFGLGYTDETICSIQNIQKSAIRKARQRIRNKLNFENDINLNEYFRSKIPNNIDTFSIKEETFMN